MARQRMSSVRLRCGHFILVPSYQTRDPEAYGDHDCQKCTAGPQTDKAKGWKKGRDAKED